MSSRTVAPVLRAEGLSLAYASARSPLSLAVRDVSLELEPGRVLGLAGESGCGKSTLARALLGFLPQNCVRLAGSVFFDGADLLSLRRSVLRRYWGARLAYVPQEVASALNPSRRVRNQLDETLKLHTRLSRSERTRRIEDLLDQVQIESGRESLSRYPFEFSGGQQQRIALTLAMLLEPEVLVLDEPTTGIDAVLRVEVVQVLRDLLAGRATSVLYISHDLTETASVADELAIMYAGEIVEAGPALDVFDTPRHPYSAALRASVPTVDDEDMVEGIPGRPPEALVEGRCAYTERCRFAAPVCSTGAVPLEAINGNRLVRCVRVHELRIEALARHGTRLDLSGTTRTSGLLALENVECTYHLPGGVKVALASVTFSVAPHETLGIVGESGSGKSTLLRAIAGLHRPSAGTMRFDRRLLPASARERDHAAHRAIQLVFQNPERSLNPRHRVAQLVEAPLRLFESELSQTDRRARVTNLLEQVQLSPRLLSRYPRELSGGEKQRVALARAFAASPQLLLCDEVVSALDVSAQAGVMNLIKAYASETGAAVLFVTHDLAVVRMMLDRIMVLRHGEICEIAPTATLFESPVHSYTAQLLASLPRTAPVEAHQSGG